MTRSFAKPAFSRTMINSSIKEYVIHIFFSHWAGKIVFTSERGPLVQAVIEKKAPPDDPEPKCDGEEEEKEIQFPDVLQGEAAKKDHGDGNTDEDDYQKSFIDGP